MTRPATDGTRPDPDDGDAGFPVTDLQPLGQLEPLGEADAGWCTDGVCVLPPSRVATAE